MISSVNKYFVKFPSIDGFHVTYKNREFQNRDSISYIGKLKLHGTSGAVRLNANGEVFAFKRSGGINLDNDNFNFAKFVNDNFEYFQSHKQNDKDVVIYGEWAGRGIQKGVALSEIEQTFFPFTKYFVEEDYFEYNIEMEKHSNVVPINQQCATIQEFTLTKSNTKDILEWINEKTEEVSKCDPLAKELYGVEGVGEGWVFYPLVENCTREMFSRLAFKAKGEEHRVNKSKKAVEVDVEKISTMNQFVDMFVTEQRLQQGAMEVSQGEFNMKNISEFIKWVSQDVMKESEVHRIENCIEWKNVVKGVNQKAALWFKNNCMKIV